MAYSLVADPLVPVPAAILGVHRDTADVFTVSLDVSMRPDGFPFAPGQFNMLYLFGGGEVPISISGDPAAPERLVHTIRAVGAVTQPMRHLKRGAFLGVRGPFGTSWPLEAARGKDVVLVAGGIGLAPLRPVIYHLLRHRADYDRVIILYGARSPEEMLFATELERWRGRFDTTLLVTVDRGGARWHGYVGVVTSLLSRVRFDPLDSIAMLCGPEIMMRYTVRDLRLQGMTDDRIWVSMERNMRCGVGLCGHCQIGPRFVCKDGPVYRMDRIASLFDRREV
jgi:NAD(P)H-flavin reductase